MRAEDVRLPDGAMFVIANSLTVSKKAESADWHYNMRVTECRLATVALALACGIPPARTLPSPWWLALGWRAFDWVSDIVLQLQPWPLSLLL